MSEPTVPYGVGPRPSAQAAIVAAAYLHPRGAVRERMRPEVEAWIASLRPLHDERAVASALDRERGTAIEPFLLSEPTRSAAIALLRGAFSRAAQVQAVRIVSEDTLGDEGGLLVRWDLSTEFLPRFGRERAAEEHRRELDWWSLNAPEDCGWRPEGGQAPADRRDPYFAPPLIPAGERGQGIFVPVAAAVRLQKDGAVVRAALGPLSGAGVRLGPVRVAGAASSRDRTGLSARALADGLEIRTGDPESLIRFASLCARRAVLVVEAWDEARRGAVCIRLAPLAGTTLELRARAFVWSDLSPWLSLALPPSTPLLRWARETAEWVGPQPEWEGELLSQEEEHETVARR